MDQQVKIPPGKASEPLPVDKKPRLGEGRVLEAYPFQWQGDENGRSSSWCFKAGVIDELRLMYADIVRQPLPDHLGELVSSLIKQEDRHPRQLKGR